MTPNQLRETLSAALQEIQPQQFKLMTAAGTLDTYLASLISQAIQSEGEARQAAINAAVSEGNPGYIDDPVLRVQTLNSQFKAAQEIALAQAIEAIRALSAAPAAITA